VAPNDLPRPINDSLAVLLQQEGSRPPKLAKSQGGVSGTEG
jgi:hypothetical protein